MINNTETYKIFLLENTILGSDLIYFKINYKNYNKSNYFCNLSKLNYTNSNITSQNTNFDYWHIIININLNKIYRIFTNGKFNSLFLNNYLIKSDIIRYIHK